MSNYDNLQICNLEKDLSHVVDIARNTTLTLDPWSYIQYENKWFVGSTAGGPWNIPSKYIPILKM